MTDPVSTHAWHVPAGLLQRFAIEPAGLDDTAASSIESHLVACSVCRARVATSAPLDVAGSWDGVADRIDRPSRSVVERLLERLGAGTSLARLVGATPGLWFAGVIAVTALAFAAAAVSRTAGAAGPFLVLAPLVPLLAVGVTFAPAADPAGEVGIATPMYGIGLALRRAAVVVTMTFSLLAVAALAVPGVGVESAAWVLPAVALVLGSLALATWWRLELCVSVLAVTWVGGTAALRLTQGRHLALPESSLFAGTGQAGALVVALLAGVVLYARSDRFATLEVRS